MNRRGLLEDVAAGRVSPSEAARLLEAPVPPTATTAVRLRAAYRAVDVVGDPGVAEVLVVDGDHHLEREGDLLVVGDAAPAGLRFAGTPLGRRLALRVNPRLAIDVEVTGGALSVWGTAGPLRAVVQAGTGVLEGVRDRLDLRVVSGAVRVAGAPVTGDWQIRAEGASVAVLLDPAADATVSVAAQHSHVAGLGAESPARLGRGTRLVHADAAFSDLTIGSG